jgi:actin related protein 2/3 complex subunit 3
LRFSSPSSNFKLEFDSIAILSKPSGLETSQNAGRIARYPVVAPTNGLLLQAYHSVFLDEPNQHLIGNFALLPLRTRTRGPAMTLPNLPAGTTELDIDAAHESYDPLDEVLALFRANTFFRNFEIKGPADRVLIYGILFVQDILGKIKSNHSRRDAEKAVMNVALDTNFAIPGDATFPLNQAFEAPRDRNEAETLRQYIMQMRQELAARLLARVYANGDSPSKVCVKT